MAAGRPGEPRVRVGVRSSSVNAREMLEEQNKRVQRQRNQGWIQEKMQRTETNPPNTAKWKLEIRIETTKCKQQVAANRMVKS